MADRSIPPGWKKNPTAWPRRILLAALALLGFGVSAYLAAFQLGLIPGVWDPFFGSRKVLTFLGIPDAALGALAYGAEVFLSLVGGRDRWRSAPWTVLAFGAVILSAALVSLGLILMQAFVVDAWCTLCLISAAVSLAVFSLGVEEPLAGLGHLKRVRGSGGSAWDALWGRDGAPGRRERTDAG